jgi:cytochrome c peroxidase
MRKIYALAVLGWLCLALVWAPENSIEEQKVELGRQLFFEKKLSEPDGQACSVCHSPRTAFSDPFHETISEGMLYGFFVARNSPSLTYCKYIPALQQDQQTGEWYGGLFWDGRSNSLEHQLSGPFFNQAEMNNPDTATLIRDLRKGEDFKALRKIYGRVKSNEAAYEALIDAIATFERSDYLHAFTSKFDNVMVGLDQFSETEKRGWELFNGKAMCNRCHSTAPNAQDGKVLFTDFSYHNLGVPRNEENPFYTTDLRVNPLQQQAVDLGLGPVVNDPKQNGKFRTPTLRNVMETAPYFHNGWAPDIQSAVNFVLEHGTNGSLPEVPANVEQLLTGGTALTQGEKDYLIAFLNTLTDL